MIRLEDGMILYHASYIEINKIELHKTNPLNDFWTRLLCYNVLRPGN